MPGLVEILRQQAASGVGPFRDRAVAALDALETGPALHWQEVSVEPGDDGWTLVVESSYESGRVEVLVPRDPAAAVEVRQDTRGDSRPHPYDELFDRGKYPQATRAAEEELARIDEAGESGPDTIAAVLRVARGYAKLGRYNRATLVYDRALRTFEDSDTPEGPETVALLVEMGNLEYRYACNTLQEFTTTESLFRRAMQIAEDVLEPGHVETASALIGLARLRGLEDRSEEAGQLLDRAGAILAESDDEARTAELRLERARLLTRTGRDEEAENLLLELVESAESTRGPRHPDVGELLVELADVVARLDRTGEAILLLSRGIDVLQRSIGHDHPLVLEQSEYLAALVYEIDEPN